MRLFKVKSSTIASLVLFSSCAFAANANSCSGSEDVAFSCQLAKNGKTVSVCVDESKMMRYSYGKAGSTPELELFARAETGFDGFFNHGVGRYIWHAASFVNNEYTYIVGFSADRLDENMPISGTVEILKNDASIASLACAENTILNNMDILY